MKTTENCCSKIEIMCTSISKHELKLMVEFLYKGIIFLDQEILTFHPPTPVDKKAPYKHQF